MLNLLKKSSNNGYSAKQPADLRHKFTPEELSQIKMLDLRAMMKDKGVRLSWANGQYEGKCPFHEDKARAPRLMTNQKEGVWLWRCDGGHHGGTVIDFVMASGSLGFLGAVEVLKKMVEGGGWTVDGKEKVLMPKLNGNGSSLKEILSPIQEKVEGGGWMVEGKEEIASPPEADRNDIRLASTVDLLPSTFLVERSEDQATFKYGDLIYQVKDLKNASKNSLKIILKLIYSAGGGCASGAKDSHFTDRVDLHSARARRGFANQAAERLNLQSAQVEEHLETMMEELETVTGSLRHKTGGQELPVASNKEEMNEKEKEEAMELLKDPNLLDRMASDLDKLGYVGEPINKKLCYLVATSRLLDKPISCIIRSGSGAGKSALMEQALSLMPPEDVLLFSRITPQSLFYMGREALDRKILAIDEREGSQEADYSIRTLQSRGKLTLAASTKDPKTGQWKTFIREFSARTPYMESSTKERINEENLNRSFELYLDESPEQTRRILEAQRKAAASLDVLNEGEEAHLRRLYQNAQKLLEPLEVRVPYELEVSIPKDWIRTRRDHERFLSLIKVIVLLHQKQRSLEGENLKATAQDIAIARALLEPVLWELASDLAKPVAVFYELLKKKVNQEAGEISTEDFAFTRRQVRAWLGLPDHIVKRSMKALEDLEYVEVKRACRGSRYQYSLSGQ